jgi:hypothetical protein
MIKSLEHLGGHIDNRCYEYDEDNKLIKASLASGNDGEPYMFMEFSYDKKGNFVKAEGKMLDERYPDEEMKAILEYSYDKNGNRTGLKIVQTQGEESRTAIGKYEYDPLGMITKIYYETTIDGETEIEESVFDKFVYFYSEDGFPYYDGYYNDSMGFLDSEPIDLI